MQFVDTNILLYAYDASAGDRHHVARELVGRLGRERNGAVSIQVLQEFYVNAVDKIAARLMPAHARARVQALSRWPTHAPVAADVVAAIDISADHGLSFWDAMIVRSAGEMGCTDLWSEDLGAGQTITGVRIVNPFG
jgi:predicted nucleic acid-binding protein